MLYVDDFTCPHPNCLEHGIRIEVFYFKDKEVPTCSRCGTELVKAVTGIRSKHSSWSKWQEP